MQAEDLRKWKEFGQFSIFLQSEFCLFNSYFEVILESKIALHQIFQKKFRVTNFFKVLTFN